MLFKNPKFFIFPLLTTLITASIIATAILTVYYVIGVKEFTEFIDLISNKTPDQPKSLSYVVVILGMFCIYFISSFIYAFVATATAHFSFGKFTTNNVSILNSIKHSSKKIWLIIKWALLSAAVGVILQLLSKKEEDKGGIGGIATWILVSLAGLTWQLATFFIIPMIAFEDFKLIGSIKNSAKLMKKTFGESIIADFAFSLIFTFLILIFPIGLLMLFASGEHYLAILLFPKSYLQQPDSVYFIAPVFGLTIFVVTFLISIVSTAKIIFKTAVYAYATGNPTGIFPEDLIKSSFKSKTN